MYVPDPFGEPRVEVLHELIRTRPLATLVTLSSGGLDANHVPLILSSGSSPLGTLQGHVARANPVWTEFARDTEALAVFRGPEAYVTPAWYPQGRTSGRVVPTWNYAVAHAYGTLRVVENPVWMRAHLERLTDQSEATFPDPWRVSDAPRAFVDMLLGSIVGIEIDIGRLIGKWKVSQNQTLQTRASIVKGLRSSGGAEAAEMAALVDGTSAACPRVAQPDSGDRLRHQLHSSAFDQSPLRPGPAMPL